MAGIYKFVELETFGFGPNVMKRKKVCSGCNHIIDIEEKTCPLCGIVLNNKTLYDLYKQMHSCCPDCDTVLTEGARFCPHCGTKLIESPGFVRKKIH